MKKYTHTDFVLTLVLLPFCVFSNENEEIEFNSSFLRSSVDISMFSKGNPVPEGEKLIDIYVNDSWKGKMKVLFLFHENDKFIAKPCFDSKLRALIGIDDYKINKNVNKIQNNEKCLYPNELSLQINASYDSSTQQLNVLIPQALLKSYPRGYIDPVLWDDGITSAIIKYDYNAWHSKNNTAKDYSSQYLGVTAGINFNAWRLRHRGSYNWSSNSGWAYNNNRTYLERGIAPLKSKVIFGTTNTDGQVFDSVGFRGAMLISDERMYEDSRRGYAPVIVGVANSTALVRITQRGTKIYEKTVPAGAFRIDDLYPMGSGGDLLVSIKEADGSERSFTVSNASVSGLLREGSTRYSLMVGTYYKSTVSEKPPVVLGTFRKGFSNLLTGYTGIIGSEYYKSASAGVAFNTRLGALSYDLTYAQSVINDGDKKNGQSIRVSYAKILPLTNTNITLANYRYSSSGFYDIDSAMYLRAKEVNSNSWQYKTLNRKNRIQLSATQKLPEELGSINVSASTQDYWDRSGHDTEYQMGYMKSFEKFSLGIYASKSRNMDNEVWDNSVSFNISIPLGEDRNKLNLNTTYTTQRGVDTLQNSLSGTAGDNKQYSYSANVATNRYSGDKTTNSGGLNAQWVSPWSKLGGGVSTGSGYQQYNLSLSGGTILYNKGVVLAPVMGDTMAIVEAENAAGARISSNKALQLNAKGKAAIPYLNPYRKNIIGIDPKGLSNDISLNLTSQTVIPSDGAVVLLRYETEKGHAALFKVNNRDELDFGASVFDRDDNVVGYVGQGGMIFARVKELEGRLFVKMKKISDVAKTCYFNYELPLNKYNEKMLRPHAVNCLVIEGNH